MTDERWLRVRKVLLAVVMAVAILSGFLCGLFGCEVTPTVVDMSVRPHDVCRGPVDAGKMVWWDGLGDPIGFPFPMHVRYVCKDHGPERNGWWFEAVPERRVMP